MKEIDKIRIRQWNQDNPYIQMKNLENAQPGYRVHTVNDDHHLYELPLETQNIRSGNFEGGEGRLCFNDGQGKLLFMWLQSSQNF